MLLDTLVPSPFGSVLAWAAPAGFAAFPRVRRAVVAIWTVAPLERRLRRILVDSGGPSAGRYAPVVLASRQKGERCEVELKLRRGTAVGFLAQHAEHFAVALEVREVNRPGFDGGSGYWIPTADRSAC